MLLTVTALFHMEDHIGVREFLCTWVVYHLPKNSRNLGQNVNNREILARPSWTNRKVSEINGTCRKGVHTFQPKYSCGNVLTICNYHGIMIMINSS